MLKKNRRPTKKTVDSNGHPKYVPSQLLTETRSKRKKGEAMAGDDGSLGPVDQLLNTRRIMASSSKGLSGVLDNDTAIFLLQFLKESDQSAKEFIKTLEADRKEEKKGKS